MERYRLVVLTIMINESQFSRENTILKTSLYLPNKVMKDLSIFVYLFKDLKFKY